MAAVSFPVVGLAEPLGSRSLAGWGGGTSVDEVSIRYGEQKPEAEGPSVSIRTSTDPGLAVNEEELVELAARELQSALWNTGLSDHGDDFGSPEESALRWAERGRAVARMLAPAKPGTATIPVGGKPIPFVSLHVSELWAASAAVGDRTVTVVADRVPPESLALAEIPDLRAYLGF